MKELLTTTEAANELGISPRRVLQLIDAQILPAIRVGPDSRGGQWLIKAKDLRLAKSRTTRPGPVKKKRR